MAFSVANSTREMACACTPLLFRETTRRADVGAICASIADCLEAVKRGDLSREEFKTKKNALKNRLPAFYFHALFREEKQEGKATNHTNDNVLRLSGLSIFDIDDLPDPRAYWEMKSEELRTKNVLRFIALAHVTPSGEGLRLVFVMPEGEDLEGAQRWMAAQLEVEAYDKAVKDYARASFAVPEEYILYINEKQLFSSSEELEELEGVKGVKPNVLDTDSKELKELEGVKGVIADTLLNTNQKVLALTPSNSSNFSNSSKDNSLTPNFKGMPYRDIIARWFQLTGGEPVEGERNDKLHRLASHLRYITDNNEALLLQIMPRYGLPEEEMKGLIHSACSAKWYAMPKVLRTAMENGMDTPEGDFQLSTSNFQFPAMPDKLPPLIRLLISRTPELYKPAVAHAVFPPLGAHLHNVRFRYIDNVEHEATLMNVLMAGTGAGKDCISEPINRIMADIRLRDAENLRREREWKAEVNSKGSNKDKRQRPEGLVIQEIDADMTNPAFVLRTAEAEGHFLYTKLNEIDQFDALRGSGRGGQQFQIMCLAFDPGNRYGQTRVGTQSITEKVTIRFNWNAATTILKGKRYFAKVLTDGPISRINFCTIPEREIGAEMPVYGTYDAAFDEELRPYIERLTRATGLIECPEAYRLAKRMQEEHAEAARLSQDRVYENLSFRANVIAYLKACVLYVAHGGKWDKSIEAFVRWSFAYDMACKMEFFGDAIARAMREDTGDTPKRPGRRNLLTLLPDEFTLQEAVRVRQSEGLDAEGTRNMLAQWAHRNYITILTNDNYRKLKYRNDGNDIDPKSKA